MIEWNSTEATFSGVALALLVINVVFMIRNPATRRVYFLGTLVTLTLALLPIASMLPSQSLARRAVYGSSLALMATALLMMAFRFPSSAAVPPGDSK